MSSSSKECEEIKSSYPGKHPHSSVNTKTFIMQLSNTKTVYHE